MRLKTNGWKSSEFILLVVGLIVVIGLVVSENALGWKIRDDAYQLIMILLGGGGAVYAGGRSFYKGKQAEAIAKLGSRESGEESKDILQRLGVFVTDALKDAVRKDDDESKKA